MATNTFCKSGEIKGSSKDDAHPEWIEVLSFKHSFSQPTSGPSGTSSSGSARADFLPFEIKKHVDTASVNLYIYCADGTQFKENIEFEVCQKVKEKQICYLKYVMEKAMVSSISITGEGSELPIETVSFVCSKISWTYTPVVDNEEGVKVGPKAFNLETNSVVP